MSDSANTDATSMTDPSGQQYQSATTFVEQQLESAGESGDVAVLRVSTSGKATVVVTYDPSRETVRRARLRINRLFAK